MKTRLAIYAMSLGVLLFIEPVAQAQDVDQGDETMQLVALDDLQFPGAGLGDCDRGLRSVISAIGEDALDEREKAAGAPIENEQRPIAILHIGGMDGDVQQEAERIDENVPLAARDLLARIKALRVERGAPF